MPITMGQETKRKHPRGKGAWYHITIYSCVLCGRETVYRERRYDDKPEDSRLRTEWIEDACSDHFI